MAKKLKLPKRIAGVKIPKAIRKGPVRDFMNSRAGQVVIAEALVAAAGAFTAKKAVESGAKGPTQLLKHPGDGIRKVIASIGGHGPDQAQHVTFALKEAARAFKDAMESGPPAGEAKPEVEPGKKKALAREPGSVPH